MILKLIESIAMKILKNYPDYTIINDKLEQNFGNVMHIKVLPINVKRVVGNRYQTEARVIITIFNDNIDEILKLSKNMYHTLEILEFGDEKIKGFDYSFSIQDKVGVIDIKYNIWEYIVDDDIKMEKLIYGESIKNEREN